MKNKRTTKIKRMGGRKPLPEGEKATASIRVRLTPEEHSTLMANVEGCGSGSISEYVRTVLLDDKKNQVLNPKELLKSLNTIGTEIGHIGGNINQLAFHCNLVRRQGGESRDVIKKHDELLREYVEAQNKLSAAFRNFLRKT